MLESDAAELSEIVVSASRHVFPSCGIPLAEQLGDAVESPEKQLVAFMGFTGDALRGTMAIVVPTELMRQAYPLPLRDPDHAEFEVFDWAAEVANRLLGRIKVALAARSVEIEASTPRVMLAEQLHVTRSMRSTICSACFASGNTSLRVWFDAISSEGQAIFGVVSDDFSQAEGDVLLF
jgi:hypothetical protein